MGLALALDVEVLRACWLWLAEEKGSRGEVGEVGEEAEAKGREGVGTRGVGAWMGRLDVVECPPPEVVARKNAVPQFLRVEYAGGLGGPPLPLALEELAPPEGEEIEWRWTPSKAPSWIAPGAWRIELLEGEGGRE